MFKKENTIASRRGFSPWLGISKMARVSLGDWTEQVYEPILRPVSVYHCQLDVAKFRCNNGSLFSGTGSGGARFLPEPREKERKRERERERERERNPAETTQATKTKKTRKRGFQQQHGA